MRTPYCYLIGWPEHDKWYYGVRYAAGCHPDELWVTYFTSSKHVTQFIVAHGQPAVTEIRKIFRQDQISEAREWEHRVLRRSQATTNERWLNKTHNKSRPPLYGTDNPVTRSEVKKKISESVARIAKEMGENFYPRTQAFKDQMNLPDAPSKRPEVRDAKKKKMLEWGDNNPAKNSEFRTWLSELHSGENNPFYGKSHSAEFKAESSLRWKGKSKKQVTCPHCSKTGGINAMVRWHFDNCKSKT